MLWAHKPAPQCSGLGVQLQGWIHLVVLDTEILYVYKISMVLEPTTPTRSANVKISCELFSVQMLSGLSCAVVLLAVYTAYMCCVCFVHMVTV